MLPSLGSRLETRGFYTLITSNWSGLEDYGNLEGETDRRIQNVKFSWVGISKRSQYLRLGSTVLDGGPKNVYKKKVRETGIRMSTQVDVKRFDLFFLSGSRVSVLFLWMGEYKFLWFSENPWSKKSSSLLLPEEVPSVTNMNDVKGSTIWTT